MRDAPREPRVASSAPVGAAVRALVGAVALGSAVTSTQAQDTNPAALRIVPSATASQTITDNYRPGSGSPEGDGITQFGVGLHLSSGTRLFNGSVDYGLTRVIYARHSDENQSLQTMSARARSEFAEGQGSLDASATISRQAISAFGVQSSDPTLINANTTEVRSLSLAPSWRGRFPGLWNYEATAEYATTRTDSDFGDSSAGRASLRFDRSQQGRVSWSVLAQRAVLKYTATRDTYDGRVNVTGNVDLPEADLKVSMDAGYERSNVTTVDLEADNTWGAGLVWAPSPRTRVDANYEKRQFGNTHSLNFEYRTARTVWSYTNNLGISSVVPGGNTTFFDLYYQQFASIEPDPAKRTQLVNNFLQQNGINANGSTPATFLTRTTTYSNQQVLSFALRGVRSGVTVSASATENWQANPGAQVGGDLANGQHVYQNGLILDLSHRLTPQSSLNLIGAVTDSHGSLSSNSNSSTRLQTLTLAWTNDAGRNVSVSALLRHSNFQSQTAPYRENAAIATATLRF